ncbi:hypothetical protein TNCV_1777971 [Trichonephila clavipes]|nr:hypothetical protein TNCV_1777971 [Trichonephila clavipes]
MSKYRRFALLRKIFQPGSGNGEEREIVLNRCQNSREGKYRCVQPKINLLKTTFLCLPVKHNVFLWNLPDVEEIPSHDGEKLSSSEKL